MVPRNSVTTPDAARAAAANVSSIQVDRSGEPAGKLRHTTRQSHKFTAAMPVTDRAAVLSEVPGTANTWPAAFHR
jgi:hypothetical protein